MMNRVCICLILLIVSACASKPVEVEKTEVLVTETPVSQTTPVPEPIVRQSLPESREGQIDAFDASMGIIQGTLKHCINAEGLPLKIVQKMDRHHYELTFDEDHNPIHIVLETKRANFRTPGHLMGIGVKSGKSASLRLRNGFDKKVAVIVECAIVPLPREFSEYERANLPYWSIRDVIHGK